MKISNLLFIATMFLLLLSACGNKEVTPFLIIQPMDTTTTTDTSNKKPKDIVKTEQEKIPQAVADEPEKYEEEDLA